MHFNRAILPIHLCLCMLSDELKEERTQRRLSNHPEESRRHGLGLSFLLLSLLRPYISLAMVLIVRLPLDRTCTMFL